MKVSIVTTCYNRVSSVPRTIRSVMSQSYSDLEHIVIDGLSTDGSVDAIKDIHSPRIKHLISERDHGAYEALNKGLRLASGEIVGWLHSDDVFYDDEVIRRVVEVFENTDCDLVYGDGIFISPSNPSWVIRDWKGGQYSDKNIAHGWLPLHTSVFVRRSVLERFGYYREDYRISSDTDWLLKVMYKTGIHIEYLNSHLVIMNYGGLSTSWSKTILRWREDLSIYCRHGISPRKALMQKIARKVPQFLSAPFSRLPFGYLRHILRPVVAGLS